MHNYLMHYGVKGMEWGKRKAEDKYIQKTSVYQHPRSSDPVRARERQQRAVNMLWEPEWQKRMREAMARDERARKLRNGDKVRLQGRHRQSGLVTLHNTEHVNFGDQPTRPTGAALRKDVPNAENRYGSQMSYPARGSSSDDLEIKDLEAKNREARIYRDANLNDVSKVSRDIKNDPQVAKQKMTISDMVNEFIREMNNRKALQNRLPITHARRKVDDIVLRNGKVPINDIKY